jgi:hypothetical protein
VTLDEFLIARIAEREAFWRGLIPSRENYYVATDAPYDEGLVTIADVNVAEMLADCEAKRRLVELSQSVEQIVRGDDAWADSTAGLVVAYRNALCVFAAIHSDHPDYDERWRP